MHMLIAESLWPSKVQGFFTVQGFHKVFLQFKVFTRFFHGSRFFFKVQCLKKPCENFEL